MNYISMSALILPRTNEISKLNLRKMCEQIMELRFIYLLIYFLLYTQISPRRIKLLKGIIYLKYQLEINFTHITWNICYDINWKCS